MGRGVPHVRVQRRNGEVSSGRAGSEAGSGGGVDLQNDVEQPPSSPLSISGPPLEVGSPSPETVEQELGGQESGSREPGGQELGGDQQELPPAARSALRQLAAHNTPAHDNDECNGW